MTAIPAVALTLSVGAQTRIEPDKNGFTPEQDVELGQQAAAQGRQQLPLLNESVANDFVDDIGQAARCPHP